MNTDNTHPHFRFLARSMFLIFGTCMLIEAFPSQLLPSLPKRLVGQITHPIGLWQNEWTMFAPNPGVANAWLTAQMRDGSGKALETWSSPYWPSVGPVEKFLHFRDMNYYKRVGSPLNRVAAEDLARYIAREQAAAQGASELSLDLYSDSLQMVRLGDGETLPKADEIPWVTQSRHLTTVEFSSSVPLASDRSKQINKIGTE